MANVGRLLAAGVLAILGLTGVRAANPASLLRLPLQRLGSLYSTALAKNPILTHCIQGASISGVCNSMLILQHCVKEHPFSGRVDVDLNHTSQRERVCFF